MSKIEGQEELESIKKSLDDWMEEAKNTDLNKVDKSQIGMRSSSYLHQGTDNMSEEESAKSEQKHPAVFATVMSLFEKLKKIGK